MFVIALEISKTEPSSATGLSLTPVPTSSVTSGGGEHSSEAEIGTRIVYVLLVIMTDLLLVCFVCVRILFHAGGGIVAVIVTLAAFIIAVVLVAAVVHKRSQLPDRLVSYSVGY